MRLIDSGLRKEALSSRERVSRGGILLIIGALHLLLILWLATQSSRQQRGSEGAISLINVATPASSGSETETPQVAEVKKEADNPIVIARLPMPATIAAPSAPGSSAAEGSGATVAGGCRLADAVGGAILNDAAAMAELEGLPVHARTQADAVMLWDGRWLQTIAVPPASGIPANSSVQAAGPIRHIVEQEIRKAQAECRDTIVNGPQFIALPATLRTTMIVIGSGQWRWADLLRPEDGDEPPAGDLQAPRAPAPDAN